MTKIAIKEQPRILAINPGSTSTKIAIFWGREDVSSQTLQHSSDDLARFDRVIDQFDFRRAPIDLFLRGNFAAKALNGIAGRGGVLRPLKGGAYIISEKMCEDLKTARYGEHASNLGALLARHYGNFYRVPSYVIDPINVDEFDESSRLTGVPGIERKSRVHALNIRSVARRCALELKKDIQRTRFVIAHLGGGISVCALAGGKIIDSTDGMLGEGPFSLERAGTLPLAGMLELCFDRGLLKKDVISLLSGKSGFKGFFGVDRLPDIYRMIDNGNHKAKILLDALIRQVVKWIGAMVALMASKPDAIILTGGMIYSNRFTREITNYASHLGQIMLYPGEYEMEALAEGVIRVLFNEEKAMEY